MSRRSRIRHRPLDGILLLDKPPGMSSNGALQAVRKLFRAEKGGHTGSLDPLATGLLPICFGEATKIAGLLLGARKAYRTEARLGRCTDTDDAEGQLLRERPVPALTDAGIEAALAPLRGRIRQRPPIYSALKQGGEALYAKARRGEPVEAPEREVEVFRLELLARPAPDRLVLEIECSSGTYVRSLVRDLGEALGSGAHVAELRRLWVEPFRRARMYPLPELEALASQGEGALDACLLPIEAGLAAWPVIRLDADQARRLGQGQTLTPAQAPKPGLVQVTDESGRALGLCEAGDDGRLRPQRLFRWAAITAKLPEGSC